MIDTSKKPTGKFINLIGETFGYLTAQKRVCNNKGRNAQFLCQCKCGNKKVVSSAGLRFGKTQSCGCLLKETLCKRNTTHGMAKTRIYHIWIGMLARCYNPSDKNYGGRGISVCVAWNKFENFYAWAMAHGYQNHLEIERKENNGNYEPDNCKWATRKEQMSNTRRNRLITFNGETKTLKQWSAIVGIKYPTAWLRYKKGWPIEMVLCERTYPR